MATNQLLAITGRRRFPYRPGEAIRARAASLPAIYAARDAAEIEQANLELEQERLGLEREAFSDTKDAAKTANKLAALGVGVQGAMLIPQYRAMSAIPSTTGPSSGVPSDAGFQWGGFRNALSEHPWGTTLGGAGGGATGALVTEAAGGKKKGYKVAGGAGGGALGAYAATGDPYAAAWGALIGGGLGALF